MSPQTLLYVCVCVCVRVCTCSSASKLLFGSLFFYDEPLHVQKFEQFRSVQGEINSFS